MAALVCAISLTVGGVHAQQRVNTTAVALAAFAKQVKVYMDLHQKQKGAMPDVKAGASPADVMAFEKALAERIQGARATAGQGEVFLPDVVLVFKEIFADYYRRRTAREIGLLFDEVPNFTLHVNGIYPINAPNRSSWCTTSVSRSGMATS